MSELPQWTVYMRVERLINVTVEAATEDEARSKAEQFDIIGDEQMGDTINMQITRVRRDDQ